MKSTNFDYTGGFPFDQSILKRIQEALFESIKTFASQIGCQDNGNYILSGCNIVGANITPGIMFIDGEICPFAGAVGDSTTKIKKQTNTLTAPFENGTNPPIFIETVAVVNAAGTELQNFTRFFYVQDANYVHTDNNFTAALLAKLNGIEAGAEQNVQADWDVVNPLSDAYIKNKPNFLKVLHRNFADLGDIANNDYTISFPDLGTVNYSVYVSFESAASNAGQSATYVYVVHSKTQTSFKVRMNETGNHVQALKMNYFIIEN